MSKAQKGLGLSPCLQPSTRREQIIDYIMVQVLERKPNPVLILLDQHSEDRGLRRSNYS